MAQTDQRDYGYSAGASFHLHCSAFD